NQYLWNPITQSKRLLPGARLGTTDETSSSLLPMARLATTDETSWLLANGTLPSSRKSVNGKTCQHVRVGGQCLWFSEPTFERSWEEANSHCEAKVNGAKLASLEDPYTVLYYVRGRFGDLLSFWVGGSDSKIEGRWEWLNGQPISTDHRSFPWLRGEPNGIKHEDCLEINYHGHYNDVTCYSER
ncbi:unnamed protein product, partial [Meganyctiphanes norvegica]